MKKYIFLSFVLLFAAISCRKKDCSSIDLTKLSDIKLPDSIKTTATTLEIFLDEADVHLANDHKLIMKCRTEDDFENDRVLPGVMLWINDQWKLDDNRSNLGKIFAAKNIQPWERSRIAGILYHRHLNGAELHTDDLLTEGTIKTEFKGRVINQEILTNIKPQEQQTLKSIATSTDSALSAAGSLELRLSYNHKQKPAVDKIIAHRDSALMSLRILSRRIQEKTATAADAAVLSRREYQKQAEGFNELPLASRLILLEKLKKEEVLNELLKLNKLKI